MIADAITTSYIQKRLVVFDFQIPCYSAHTAWPMHTLHEQELCPPSPLTCHKQVPCAHIV